MPKGSALSRAVQFFRDGDMDEVRVAFTLVREVVKARLNINTASKAAGINKPARKARRTKAQMTLAVLEAQSASAAPLP